MEQLAVQLFGGATFEDLLDQDEEDADRVLHPDSRRILQQGTYEELMERGGLLAKLVERQRL